MLERASVVDLKQAHVNADVQRDWRNLTSDAYQHINPSELLDRLLHDVVQRLRIFQASLHDQNAIILHTCVINELLRFLK